MKWQYAQLAVCTSFLKSLYQSLYQYHLRFSYNLSDRSYGIVLARECSSKGFVLMALKRHRVRLWMVRMGLRFIAANGSVICACPWRGLLFLRSIHLFWTLQMWNWASLLKVLMVISQVHQHPTVQRMKARWYAAVAPHWRLVSSGLHEFVWGCCEIVGCVCRCVEPI